MFWGYFWWGCQIRCNNKPLNKACKINTPFDYSIFGQIEWVLKWWRDEEMECVLKIYIVIIVPRRISWQLWMQKNGISLHHHLIFIIAYRHPPISRPIVFGKLIFFVGVVKVRVPHRWTDYMWIITRVCNLFNANTHLLICLLLVCLEVFEWVFCCNKRIVVFWRFWER